MRISFEIEPNLHDLWIGVYWKTKAGKVKGARRRLVVYLNLIPGLPIKITF
mgnify:CR=1 FL=1|jgi:hypothetical protein